MSELDKAISVIEKLRHPSEGCPWDLKQTHQSLLKYLFEEAYEFEAAVLEKNTAQMRGELGDLLLQVILHSAIAKGDGHFTLEDVARELKEKIVRRHPHVFSENKEKLSSQEVTERWQEIKKEEKKGDSTFPPEIRNFPSLICAQKIGSHSAKVSFDWENAAQVSYKVEEEWQELKEELAPSTINKERAEEELGDFLFSTVQLARHLDIDADMALRKANFKFLKRFELLEKLVLEEGRDIKKLSQAELDLYWVKAKKVKKNEA